MLEHKVLEPGKAEQERVVCDGCRQSTVWYNSKLLTAEQVCTYNDIKTVTHESETVHVCINCQRGANRAMAAVVGMPMVATVDVPIEGPGECEDDPPLPAPEEAMQSAIQAVKQFPAIQAPANQAPAPNREPMPTPNPTPPQPNATLEHPMVGTTYCITGTLSVTRNEFKGFIEDLGGTVANKALNADYLILGVVKMNKDGTPKESSKQKDAADKGIKVLSEEEFWEQVEDTRLVIDAEWEVTGEFEDKTMDEGLLDIPLLPAAIDNNAIETSFDCADQAFADLEKLI